MDSIKKLVHFKTGVVLKVWAVLKWIPVQDKRALFPVQTNLELCPNFSSELKLPGHINSRQEQVKPGFGYLETLVPTAIQKIPTNHPRNQLGHGHKPFQALFRPQSAGLLHDPACGRNYRCILLRRRCNYLWPTVASRWSPLFFWVLNNYSIPYSGNTPY